MQPPPAAPHTGGASRLKFRPNLSYISRLGCVIGVLSGP